MAIFTVTSALDDNGAGLTLREALAAAEANGTGADTIVFDASLAGQTIRLTSGVLAITSGTVSISGDTNGDGNPDIIISGDVTNNGRTSDDTEILSIGSYATASLTSVQLSDGYGRGADNTGAAAYGAVYNAGTLTITDSIISGNYARGGTGFSPGVGYYNNGGRGGNAAAGILNVGTLTVTETAFQNNVSYGGNGGTGAAENTFAGNYSGGDGGHAGSIINSGTADFSHVGFLSYSYTAAGDGGTGGAQNTGYMGGTGGNGGSAAVGIVNTGTSTGEAGYRFDNVSAGGGFAGLGGTGTPNGGAGSFGSDAITLNYLSGTVTAFTNLGSAPFANVTSGGDTITGTGFGDLIISLTGNDVVDAGIGEDTVYGGAGNDQLFGGIDNDTLFGGSGDDFINGQTEDDTVEGGLGNDTMEGGSNTAAGDTVSFAHFVATSGTLGVTVNLNLTTQQNTAAGLDTITGFENLTGSDFDDTLTGENGTGLNNIVNGLGGNDTLVMKTALDGTDHFNGGSGSDTMLSNVYWAPSIVFDMGLGTASFMGNVFNTFEQIENLIVGGYAQVIGDNLDNIITVSQDDNAVNTLSGGGGDDTIEGGRRGDILDGGSNGAAGDTVSYSQSSTGVTVNLGLTIQTGTGDAVGDSLTGFENVTGSAFDDTITDVGGVNNTLNGGAGDDILVSSTYIQSGGDHFNGGADVDTLVANFDWTGGTIFDMNLGITSLGFGTLHTFEQIENITVGGGASVYGDGNNNIITVTQLVGTYNANTINGGGGDDTIEGGMGADILVGGNNYMAGDTVSYSQSATGVRVNLGLTIQTGTGDAAGDSLTGFENVNGSAFDDTLIEADGIDNTINGGAGDDTLVSSTYSYTDDHFNGGADTDTLVSNFAWIGGTIFDMNLGNTSLGFGVLHTFEQIENITVGGGASVYGDGNNNVITVTQLVGTYNANILNGGGGDDIIEGGMGADILVGGSNGLAGDTVSYRQSSAGVTVNLGLMIQTGAGDAAGDSLTGFENVTGSSHNDTLAGNAGANVINGGVGTHDVVDYSGSTAAVVVSLLGTAAQSGGHAQGDTLIAIEDVTGSTQGDTLIGSALANTLIGGSGDDVLRGWSGADVINGGAGTRDVADYTGSTAGVVVSLLVATAQSGGHAQGDTLTGIEDLTGSAKGDTLIGSALANILLGGSGDDVLRGWSGADVINGGTGIHDVADYTGSTAGVVVSLLGTAAQSGGHAQGDTLTGIEDLTGSAQGDTLIGSTAANILLGGSGDDVLRGWSGADVVNGGAGTRDVADYTGSNAAVVVSLLIATAQSGGHAQGDTLIGIEDLTGSAQGDTLIGSALDNILLGGSGDDTLRGWSGADVINGGAGTHDVADYTGSNAAVVVSLVGGAVQTGGHALGDTLIGIEDLTGSSQGDTLTGNSLANILSGAGGADILDGGGSTDTLLGGSGTDRLTGGTGDDTLNGGGDADVFVYNIATLWNNDTITGWQNGLDKIDLVGAGFDFGDFSKIQDGQDTILALITNMTHSIRLVGINATTIDATDFI